MSGTITDIFYQFFSGYDCFYWIIVEILVFIVILYLLKPSGHNKKGN